MHTAETAAQGTDREAAVVAHRKAEGALARGASRGTLHWKTAARRASRLSKRMKKAAGK